MEHHRLSAIIAWIMMITALELGQFSFMERFPEHQERMHNKTRELVNNVSDRTAEWIHETGNAGSIAELRPKGAGGLAHARVPLLWFPGNDATKAEKAFFTIQPNQRSR